MSDADVRPGAVTALREEIERLKTRVRELEDEKTSDEEYPNRPKINDCEKCGGEGWLWGRELDEASEATRADTMTRYTCDACRAQPAPADEKFLAFAEQAGGFPVSMVATSAPSAPAGVDGTCNCGEPRCSGISDGAYHQCGGPREACGVADCPECGAK